MCWVFHRAAISRDGLTTGINLSVIRVARQKADETETRLIDTCEGGGKKVGGAGCRNCTAASLRCERGRACYPTSHEYATGSLHKYRSVHLQGASIPCPPVNALIYRPERHTTALALVNPQTDLCPRFHRFSIRRGFANLRKTLFLVSCSFVPHLLALFFLFN